MVDASTQSPDALNRLHVIAHMDWVREGRATYENQRADLVDTISALMQVIQQVDGVAPVIRNYLIGGQTIILDDVGEISPNLLTMLVIYNAGGRLGLGPWYVQTDGILVSGESLVRNLLIGRQDVLERGLKPLHVAYMPFACHHSAQLPQILRGFDITATLLCVDDSIMPVPFVWHGLDDSQVLVVSYQHQPTPDEAIAHQRDAHPDGPYLWMADGIPHLDQSLVTADHIPIAQSTLADFVNALRQSLPDEFRPRLNGELILRENPPNSGRYSARMMLKQRHDALQSNLIHYTERLLTIALTHGDLSHSDNQRALLNYCWRLLIQNQAVHSLSGACIDAVEAQTRNRNQRLEDVSNRLAKGALNALHPAVTPNPDDTYTLTVWNPHSQPVTQVVEYRLRDLPAGQHPHTMTDHAGMPVVFGWDAGARVISFNAKVPAVGFSTFTLKTSAALPEGHLVLADTESERSIRNSAGDTLTVIDGQLTLIRGDYPLHHVLTYVDGGDAGDANIYREPVPDVIVEAGLTDTVHVVKGPLYERLTVRHRMRVAPELVNGGRARGLKVIDLMTTATFYKDMPGLYITVTYHNSAQDHRLRAHIRTGIMADTVRTDTAYGVINRAVASTGGAGPQPMHSLAAVNDDETLVALITRGLPEFEPLVEDNQITLALTLLRAIGHIDSQETVAAPGAQMPGDHTAEFILLEMPASEGDSLLNRSDRYRAPVMVHLSQHQPARKQHSFLSVSPTEIVLTALKPPEEGDGWVVRLLNPTDTPQTAHLTVSEGVQSAEQLTLAEQSIKPLTVSESVVHVPLKPHEVATVKLSFNGDDDES